MLISSPSLAFSISFTKSVKFLSVPSSFNLESEISDSSSKSSLKVSMAFTSYKPESSMLSITAPSYKLESSMLSITAPSFKPEPSMLTALISSEQLADAEAIEPNRNKNIRTIKMFLNFI